MFILKKVKELLIRKGRSGVDIICKHGDIPERTVIDEKLEEDE